MRTHAALNKTKNKNADSKQESLFVPIRSDQPGCRESAGTVLHLRHIFAGEKKDAEQRALGGLDKRPPAVFMLHGAVENGRVFYGPAGRGLAPFLARRGFDVFVGELRGRGKGRPHIGPGAAYGQSEAIAEDVPALLDYIEAYSGAPARFWVAHSWGGVILSSVLARFPARAVPLAGAVYFGAKRSVRALNLTRLVYIDLIWKVLCSRLTRYYGYLPARRFRIGSDDETVQSHRQSVEWVRPGPWIDSGDGFDYGAAIQNVRLPPVWFLAAQNDACLGNPRDVYDFMREHGAKNASFSILARRNGNAYDYDHISMLTHRAAVRDHFLQVAAWLRACEEHAT
jgi:predicted alpha/beta hydrolase